MTSLLRAAVADAQPRHPLTRGGAGLGRVDAQLHEPQARIGGELLSDPRQRVRLRQARVVVEEEQQLAADVRDAEVAPRGDALVGLPLDAADAVRQPARRPAVADHDHVEVDALLCEQRLESPAQLFGALALREHDAPEARSRGYGTRSGPLSM